MIHSHMRFVLRAKSKIHTFLQIFFSWLLLITIIVGTVNDYSLLGNAEFEDAIEIEERADKDGSRLVISFLPESFHVELKIVSQEIISAFHSLTNTYIDHTPVKLYLRYHQLKSYLG